MNDPVSLLSSILAILAIWVAFDVGYRSYRRDLFCDRLFELRSELFEVAHAGAFGEKGFSDPVYCHVRRMLTGSMRCAQQMTLSRLLVLLWSSRWWLDHEVVRGRNVAFDKALAAHRAESRYRVKQILRELDFAIVMHMLHTSVIGFALISTVEMVATCLHVQQQARAAISRKIVRNRKLLEPLEQDALCGLERLEHRVTT